MSTTDNLLRVVGGVDGAGVEAGRASQATLREHNLALVSRTVFASPAPLSRADLAARTGMTRSTVSRLVEDLLAARILAERTPAGGRRGRPAVPLAPAPGSLTGLGLELNVDYMAGSAVDLTGRVVAERILPRADSGAPPAEVMRDLGTLAVALAQDVDDAGATLAGTVLALPGLVDRSTDRLLFAPNLGWRDVAPLDLIGRDVVLRLGGHVTLSNEADVAALACALSAPGRLTEDRTFLYVSTAIGIGAAVMIGGSLLSGSRGWAGELGHVCIDPDGIRCRCGAQGCLEQYAGKPAVLRAAGLPPDAPASALLDALEGSGGPAAQAALDQAAKALGIALSDAVNVLGIQDIVLGGSFVELVEHLRPGIEYELGARVLAAPWSQLKVRAAGRDLSPAVTGGALAALGRVIDEPARWAPPVLPPRS